MDALSEIANSLHEIRKAEQTTVDARFVDNLVNLVSNPSMRPADRWDAHKRTMPFSWRARQALEMMSGTAVFVGVKRRTSEHITKRH